MSPLSHIETFMNGARTLNFSHIPMLLPYKHNFGSRIYKLTNNIIFFQEHVLKFQAFQKEKIT